MPLSVKPLTSTSNLVFSVTSTTTTTTSRKLKRTTQKSSGLGQSSTSTMVQTSIDKFMVSSKKPTAATRKASETKSLFKPIPSSTNSSISSSKTTSTTGKPATDATTATTIAINASPKTALTKPKQQTKPQLQTSPISTSSSSSYPSPKKSTPTTSTPVKRRAIILTSKKTSPSPSSPTRVKPATYFDLLPPPALSTINHNSGDSPPPIKDTAGKVRPGSSVSSSSFCSAPTHAAPKKMAKIRELIPESTNAITTSVKRTAPSSLLSTVARNTVAITPNSAAIDTKAPLTEVVSRQILKTNSALTELNPATAVTATAKTGSKTLAASTNVSSTKSSTSKMSAAVPIEILGRVIKIKSSLSTTSTSTNTTAPKAAAGSSGTVSPEVKKRVSKPTKASLTLPDTTIATQAQASKTKSHLPVPKTSSVALVKPKTKPKPSNNSSNVVDLVSSTTTTKASAATVVPKSKITSKDAITSGSSKYSTTPKTPKTPKSSSTTTTSPTTIFNPSSKDNNTPAPKPTKSLIISTAASKTKTKDKKKDTLQQATATTTIIKTTEDISMDSSALLSASASSQSPRRGSFSFSTSPSGIVLSLYTKHNLNPNLKYSHHHINSDHLPTITTATSTPFQPPPTPAPISHPQPYHTNITGSSPRPKRLLELALQEDCEDCNTQHINEYDSPYYYHHRSRHFLCREPLQSASKEYHLAQIRDSLRPQKRQRISDVSNCASVAGRRYGMFDQIAFEQALAKMSFKHPTLPPTSNPSASSHAPTTTASQRLHRFQKRLHQGNSSSLSMGATERGRRNDDEQSTVAGGSKGALRRIP